ncbi:23S rRNA (adenine(1618)-N(6))-methyltransferase RlmF [Aeromonas molluscorum]|jgi:23S rRNA (adenine1618-N6)-methyltransferase|uniref:Ribosomal RNA large subunit methyltransferase F n=1 Tax=Aeromonas molluscorum 848 TaxID=1268236 RepID=R1GW48_9GAMM|nr:23S rRNA mA1618 methyltransferase [Aeromonas molluscorum 848]
MTRETATKAGLHPRNRHHAPYDLAALCLRTPELTPFVFTNDHGTRTLDFADPAAVKALNKALLALHYGIRHWDLPAGYLCPPIPGRVDYLHHVADLISEGEEAPRTGKGVRVLDIGVGANCIYPLLGCREYGWRFVGADIDPVSVKAANLLALSNGLGKQIECRLQTDARRVFHGIIGPRDRFTLTLCNPPFHSSLAEASEGTRRKLRNLGKAESDSKPPVLNFGGQKAELWCDGGEAAFLASLIRESRDFAGQCLWFSSLVSKKENLAAARLAISQAGAKRQQVIEMNLGNKQSRILAWSFQSDNSWSD